MADKNELMMLEAIRLEIRAATKDLYEILGRMANSWPHSAQAVELRNRADRLSKLSFYDTFLANDEKEALGHEVE